MNRGTLRGAAAGLFLALSSVGRAGDEPPVALDALKAAIREARSIEDRALLLQTLGTADPGDSGVVSELAHFLAPTPSDLNLLLPVTAAQTLGRMRGSRLAALALTQALPAVRKMPYLHRRMVAALGQVGHEAVLPVLGDLLAGNDPESALLSIRALEEMPADLALEGLLRGWEWMQLRRAKVGDDVKKSIDRLAVLILGAVQRVSGEKYPTLPELELWWSRHKAPWKEIAQERERERAKRMLPPSTTLPPLLLVELLFNDGAGSSSSNGGSSSTTVPSASLTKVRPAWSHEIPPPGGAGSLDWGTDGGPFAVDLPGMGDHLKNLKSFTITGWINVRSATEGAGGNRIVSWLDREGVEIVHRSDGSLQVGLNQKADGSPVRTPPGLFPPVDPKAVNAVFLNWRFFAVTYDSTAPSLQAKIYSGTRDLDATLVAQMDSPRGSTGCRICPALAIGNLPAALRVQSPRCSFRGLIDEVRLYGSTRDGSGALPLSTIVQLQGRL